MAKTCHVCKKADGCYKCSGCREPYCSVGCYKIHKRSTCQPKAEKIAAESVKETSASYVFPTEDTVPIEKLERLRCDKRLKNCLQNPHVRDIMCAILSSENPTKTIALAMTEPIFVEMADACLKTVEPLINE